jgi:hypothetical protein
LCAGGSYDEIAGETYGRRSVSKIDVLMPAACIYLFFSLDRFSLLFYLYRKKKTTIGETRRTNMTESTPIYEILLDGDRTQTFPTSGAMVNYNFYSFNLNSVLNNLTYNTSVTMKDNRMGQQSENGSIDIDQITFVNNSPHLKTTDVSVAGSGDQASGSYMIKKIRIMSNAHKKKSTSILGEIVIELFLLSENPKTMSVAYFVIPLSNTNYAGTDSPLDLLIKSTDKSLKTTYPDAKPPARLNLNELIASGLAGSSSTSTSDLRAYMYQPTMVRRPLFSDLGADVTMATVPTVFVLDVAIPLSSECMDRVAGYYSMYSFFSIAEASVNPTEFGKLTIYKEIAVKGAASSAGSDDIYIDCSPEEDAGDGGWKQMTKSRAFLLTDKDVSNLCIAFLITLSWVVLWYIINDLTKGLPATSAVIQTFCGISGMASRAIYTSKDGSMTLRVGQLFMLVFFVFILFTFIGAFLGQSVNLFMFSVYMLSVFLGLLYCSCLPVFTSLCAKTPSPTTPKKTSPSSTPPPPKV